MTYIGMLRRKVNFINNLKMTMGPALSINSFEQCILRKGHFEHIASMSRKPVRYNCIFCRHIGSGL